MNDRDRFGALKNPSLFLAPSCGPQLDPVELQRSFLSRAFKRTGLSAVRILAHFFMFQAIAVSMTPCWLRISPMYFVFLQPYHCF